MIKTNIHTDLYENKQFTGMRVESGYIGDCDIHIDSSEISLAQLNTSIKCMFNAEK